MKPGSRRERLQNEDILGERSNSRQRKRTWSSEETEDDEQRASIAIKRIRTVLRQSGRKRQYYSASSESSEVSNKGYPKIKREDSGSSANANMDKVLRIVMDFKSFDESKLSYYNIIPDFDPKTKQQTVLTWLTKVEEYAKIYGWDEKEIIRYSLPKLRGVAKSWLQGLPTLLHSWSEWKTMLIESFPFEENYAELLTEMLDKRASYGEPLEEYYYAKMNLLNRCDIRGRKAVDCLLHGVDDRTIRFCAQAAQFATPESVLKYFRSAKVGSARNNNLKTSDT